MTPLDIAILAVALVTNVTAFILMGVDKRRARRKAWRIPERTLLLWCAALGAPGGYLGMKTFRHKTQHTKFTIGVPVMLILQVALVALYAFKWR